MEHRKPLLEHFMPEHGRWTAEKRSQALNLIGISFALGIAGLFFTLRYYLLGLPMGSLGILMASLVALSCPFVLRLSGQLGATRLLAMSTLTALLLWLCYLADGVMSSSLFWFSVVPVAAIFTGGWRHGLIWAPISIAMVLFLQIGEASGFFQPLSQLPDEAIRPIQLSSALVLIAVMAIMALLFERARRRSVADMQAMSTELESAGETMASCSRDIARQAHEVGSLLTAQVKEGREIERMLEGLDSSGQRNRTETQEMASGVNTAETRAREGGGLVHETVNELEQLNQSVSVTASELNQLSSDSRSLMDVVALIENIARQTHRLALNASIEAARAGAEGRSFGVVAEEVRALAERCQQAANEIGKRIGRLMSGIQEGATGMTSAAEGMMKSRERASQADTALGEIVAASQRLSQQGQSVSKVSEEQARTQAELRQRFDTLSHMLNRIGQASEQIDEAAHEVSDALQGLELRLQRQKT